MTVLKTYEHFRHIIEHFRLPKQNRAEIGEDSIYLNISRYRAEIGEDRIYLKQYSMHKIADFSSKHIDVNKH